MKALRWLFGTGYALVALSPALVFAMGTKVPTQLVPCTGVNCTCSHIVILIQNIINMGIMLVVVGSALLFAYAGFLYLTNEAIGAQNQARSIFKNVAIGLVIMLAAWLIVDTLMNSLLKREFGQWNAIQPVDEICQRLGIYQSGTAGSTSVPADGTLTP